MDVSRRDFIRLGTSAAVTTTAVAQAGGAQSAPVLLAQSPALTVRAGRPFGRPPLPVPFLY